LIAFNDRFVAFSHLMEYFVVIPHNIGISWQLIIIIPNYLHKKS
jgi:hypothetical protein